MTSSNVAMEENPTYVSVSGCSSCKALSSAVEACIETQLVCQLKINAFSCEQVCFMLYNVFTHWCLCVCQCTDVHVCVCVHVSSSYNTPVTLSQQYNSVSEDLHIL